MDKCPKCKNTKIVKNGKTETRKQRYLCKNCGYQFSVKYQGKPISVKKKALELYLEGLGFRAIGRILKVSNVNIGRWIKKWADHLRTAIKAAKPSRKDIKIEEMELDELWHYAKKNGIKFGFGLLLTGRQEKL
jgi:transposase